MEYTNTTAVSDSVSLEEALKPTNDRIADHQVYNGSINANKLGDIISGNPASTALGTGLSSGLISIPATSGLSYVFTVTDNYKRVVLAVPDVAIYIDGLTSSSLFPNSSYGLADFAVAVYNDWGLTDNVNTVTRVAVRNNLGASHNVAVIIRWRIITNSTQVLQGLTSPNTGQ